jgi:hypothetical protein
MTYRDQKHNEAVKVEEALQGIDNAITELSNTLYRTDPNHPLLEQISEAKHAVEAIDFEAPYEAAKVAADEAWWDED